jgi:WD40 repeat protein
MAISDARNEERGIRNFPRRRLTFAGRLRQFQHTCFDPTPRSLSMSRISRWLFLVAAALVTAALVGSTFDVAAQDKKKEEKKADKKEPEKEVKKEPFVPDVPAIEFKGHTDWIMAVSFGPGGKTVASLSRNRVAKVWDVAAKKEIQSVKDFPSETRGFAYAGGQLFISTGKWDKKKNAFQGEIKIVSAKDGKGAKSLMGHSEAIEALSFSKDGKFLASASDDNTALIWDLAAGKTTQTIKGHTDAVISASFSPDGKQLVTTSRDKTIRVWDIAGAKELALFKVERTVEVKDPPKTKEKGKDKGKAKDDKGKVTETKELGREFTHAVFTNDGKKIVAGNLDGVVKIYDVEGKKEVKELKAHDGILALALSPDGTKIATGGWDQLIKIWNVADGKELRTIKAHLGTVTALAFSADGQWLASGGNDNLVKIWSVK